MAEIAPTTKRNYGIDLLRFVFMFIICFAHILGQGGVLENCEPGSLKYMIYWLAETPIYTVVSGFALISGYTASNNSFKYEKLPNMWFQVFFYSFILTVPLYLLGMGGTMTIVDLAKCALPVIFEKYWYFTAYFMLALVAPALNMFLFGCNESAAKKTLILLAVAFSGVTLLAEPFKTQGGNAAIWLIAIYCIGVLAKRIKLFEQKKSWVLIIALILCLGISWAVKMFTGISRLMTSVSPTMLLASLILVVLFSRIKLKGTILKKITPLAFGIYLFHLNPILWDYVLKDMFKFVVDISIPMGLLYILAGTLVLFFSGLIVEFIRASVAKLIRLNKLSEKIIQLIYWALGKVSAVLK